MKVSILALNRNKIVYVPSAQVSYSPEVFKKIKKSEKNYRFNELTMFEVIFSFPEM